MKFQALLFFALLSVCAFGQGVRYDVPPILNSRAVLVPNANISLCPGTATITNSTCSPASTQAFTDITLTTACPAGSPVVLPQTNTCQGTADALGNAGFWLAPGAYIFCINGPTITGKCYNLTKPIGSIATSTGSSINWKTPFDYGAKADVKTLTDAAITSGTAILTSASAPFNCTTDVGKTVVVANAGASAGLALVSTITSCQSTTQVTLVDNAGQTVTPSSGPTLAYFGTNDRPAVANCIANGTNVGGKCTISNGSTFMISGPSGGPSTMGASGVNGVIDGFGTLIYAPYGALTGGSNDRMIFLQGGSSNGCQIVAGAIAKGATSITVSSAPCIVGYNVGDTILIREKDLGIADIVYFDVAQVSSITGGGTVINLVTPLTVSFPNARTFNNSGSPAACFASTPCGLSVIKLQAPFVQNVTIRDINYIVPNIQAGGIKAVGVITSFTKGVTLKGMSANVAAQNCISSYQDLGLTVTGNHLNCAISNEFAANSSPTLSFNQFNAEGYYGALFNFTPPNGGGLLLDIGTGGAAVEGNTFGSTHTSGSPCFSTQFGVRDSVFANNTCAMVQSSSGVIAQGTYHNIYTANVLSGATGTGAAFNFADTTTATVQINSDSNTIIGNYVDASFSTLYTLSGSLGTDRAFDTANGGTIGAVTVKSNAATFNFFTAIDTEPSGVTWDFGPQSPTAWAVRRAGNATESLDTGNLALRIPNNIGFEWSSTSASNGGSDTGLTRVAANVVGVGNGTATNVSGEIRSAKISATYNAAGTVQTAVHLVVDTCTLGTSCGVTLTGSAAYTSATSYTCTCHDQTTPLNACGVNQTGGGALTITGTGTDVIRYLCTGN